MKAIFRLIDERDNSHRDLVLNCSLNEFNDLMDELDFEDFLWKMETEREDWCGVHDFAGTDEWIGYTSYEIKDHDKAIEKWREFFTEKGLI